MFSPELLTPQTLGWLSVALLSLPTLVFVVRVAAPTPKHASSLDIRMLFIFGGLLALAIALSLFLDPFATSRGMPNWATGTIAALVGLACLLSGILHRGESLRKTATEFHDQQSMYPIWAYGVRPSESEKDQHLDRFFKAVEDRESAEKEQG